MRVGIDARQLQYPMTGIGRYLKLLLEHVPESGHEYILYYSAEPKEPFQQGNVRMRIIPGKQFFWDHFTLAQALVHDTVDVFFSPYYKRPWNLGCKSIITVHDITPLRCSSYSFFYKRYFSALLKHSLLRTDYSIVVSEYVRRQLRELFQVPAHKLIVNYNAFDERCLAGEKDEGIAGIPAKYGIASKYILYVGNLMPHKNVPVLLKAYARLPASLKDNYRLVIAGERSFSYKQLLLLSRRLALQDHVIFTGFIAEGDLGPLYRQASLFVFPSLCEGFGFPPLEAAACGVPVIASNAASLPEVMGQGALLVNPGDIAGFSAAIAKVLTDEALHARLIQQGQLRAREFSAKKMAAGFLEVIEKVC